MVAPLVSITPQLIPQFYNSAGSPLSGGLLQVWAAGTTTPQATYSDSTGATALPNPIVLNANGNPTTGGGTTCGIWLVEGLSYKFQLQTSGGSPIWTLDNVVASGPFQFWSGTSTGSANAYALAQPQLTAYSTPLAITWIASFTNTGAATLNINSLGTKNVYRQTSSGPVALVGGEIQANQIVTVIYDGTQFQLVSPSAAAAALRDYIAGLTLSNDGSSPNTVLDIAAGQCTDSTNAIMITLGAITKSTAGTWTSGSGNNGMGTGLTIANTTWYHVFAIINNGTPDVYFDTSVTAANKPTNTTAFRRIGSFITDGSAHIVTFTQYGDEFWWTSPFGDLAQSNPGTSAVSLTIHTPLGVKCQTLGAVEVVINTVGAIVYLSSLDSTDLVPTFTTAFTVAANQLNGSQANGQFRVWTNTSSQIRYRLSGSDASVALNVLTLGWRDLRGSNS